MQSIFRSIVFASVGFLSISTAHAYLTNAKMPACLDGPDEIQVDNARVLKLKQTTKNQYLARAFVEGTVVDTGDVKTGHDHFSIAIGPAKGDTLEIIYNREFGPMPDFKNGDKVVVCGDYITSNKSAGGYQASPDGAIIHWIHFNPGNRPNSARHEHGFVMFGTNLVGFDDAPAEDWTGRIKKAPEPNHGPNDPSEESPVRAGDDLRRNDGGSNRARPAPRRGGNGGGQSTRRPNDPGRWKPCRTLDECRARNGSF